MTEYNVSYDFYTVCKVLNKTENYVYPGDIEAGDDTWSYNGVQTILTEDRATWTIISDSLHVYDAADTLCDTDITFIRGTASDLHQLAVQMRLTD